MLAAMEQDGETVVRDVLSRLHERGLIRKNQSSHWIAGPLTAQTVREKFSCRSCETITQPPVAKAAMAGAVWFSAVTLKPKVGPWLTI